MCHLFGYLWPTCVFSFFTNESVTELENYKIEDRKPKTIFYFNYSFDI